VPRRFGAQFGLFRKQRGCARWPAEAGISARISRFPRRVKTRIGAAMRISALVIFVNGGLRGTTRGIIGRLGIEAVFQNVVVKRAKVDDAIIVDGGGRHGEFVCGIPLAALFGEESRVPVRATAIRSLSLFVWE